MNSSPNCFVHSWCDLSGVFALPELPHFYPRDEHKHRPVQRVTVSIKVLTEKHPGSTYKGSWNTHPRVSSRN